MLATLASDADRTTESRQARRHRTPAVRVLPVPRSEPLTDDERMAAGLDAPPMAAQLLPLDLPTGAQVRRGPRWRGAGGADGSAGAPDAEPVDAMQSGSGACGGNRVAQVGDGARSGDEAAQAGRRPGSPARRGLRRFVPWVISLAPVCRAELRRPGWASTGWRPTTSRRTRSSCGRPPGVCSPPVSRWSAVTGPSANCDRSASGTIRLDRQPSAPPGRRRGSRARRYSGLGGRWPWRATEGRARGPYRPGRPGHRAQGADLRREWRRRGDRRRHGAPRQGLGHGDPNGAGPRAGGSAPTLRCSRPNRPGDCQ